jgi:RHS repeat-associated protein
VKNLAILAQIDTQKLELSDTLRIFEDFVGVKNYELSNHLGNVLATISDKTIFNTDHYNGIVYSAQLYYPFGWEIPTLSYTAKSYRYGFNGVEKAREIGEGVNTTFYREQDTRAGRWWSFDPFGHNYPNQSPYCITYNNPMFYVDKTGGAPSLPFDDIYINEEGFVTKIIQNSNPNRLFLDRPNKSKNPEIIFNDPSLDRAQLSDTKIGDKIVHFLSVENQHFILNKGKSYFVFRSFPIVSDVWGIFSASLTSRGGSRDFGFSLLAPQLSIEGLDKRDATIGRYSAPLPEGEYYEWDRSGGFIFFEGAGKYKVYNIPDAGNFLFGASMHASNISPLITSMGTYFADTNDSEADGKAIKDGYMQYGRISDPIGEIFGYDTKKPSFFRTPKEGDDILRKHGYPEEAMSQER